MTERERKLLRQIRREAEERGRLSDDSLEQLRALHGELHPPAARDDDSDAELLEWLNKLPI